MIPHKDGFIFPQIVVIMMMMTTMTTKMTMTIGVVLIPIVRIVFISDIVNGIVMAVRSLIPESILGAVGEIGTALCKPVKDFMLRPASLSLT